MPFSRPQASTAANSAANTAGSSSASSQPKRRFFVPYFRLAAWLRMAATRPTIRPSRRARKRRASAFSKAGFFAGDSVLMSSLTSGGT